MSSPQITVRFREPQTELANYFAKISKHFAEFSEQFAKHRGLV
jgi:hypothetical protein